MEFEDFCHLIIAIAVICFVLLLIISFIFEFNIRQVNKNCIFYNDKFYCEKEIQNE